MRCLNWSLESCHLKSQNEISWSERFSEISIIEYYWSINFGTKDLDIQWSKVIRDHYFIWKFEPSSNEPSQFQFDSIIESEPDDWIEICRIKDFGNHIIWPKDFINVNIETNKIPNWNTLVYIKIFSHLSMALMILNSFDRPHWTILLRLNRLFDRTEITTTP